MLRAQGAGGHGRGSEARPAAGTSARPRWQRAAAAAMIAPRGKPEPRIMLVNCVAYQEGRKLADIPKEDISEYVKRPNCFVWVALKDPDPSELDEMRDEFGLHELAVEDARQGHRGPRSRNMATRSSRCVQTVEPKDGELVVGEVNIFVGPNYILSIRTAQRKRVHRRARPLRARAPSAEERLGLRFLRARSTPSSIAISRCSTRSRRELEKIEENIFVKNTARSNIESLYALKQKLMTLKHAVDPLMEATGKLCGGRVPQICEGMQAYFRDVFDHLQRIHSAIEGIREMQTTAIQVNLGMINLNETEVTKKLAGWAAIIAVPTLIAGIYGMNFKNMPELRACLRLSFRAGPHGRHRLRPVPVVPEDPLAVTRTQCMLRPASGDSGATGITRFPGAGVRQSGCIVTCSMPKRCASIRCAAERVCGHSPGSLMRTCADNAARSLPMCQTCRSCTAAIPGTRASARPISSYERCAGTPSISTPVDSAQQTPGRAQDQERNGDRQDRIDRRPSGRDDDRSGDDRRGRSEQIGDHVQQRATQVQRALTAGENPRREEIGKQAGAGDPEQQSARDGLRNEQTAHRLDGDEDDQREQGERVDECGDHLGARIAVARAARRRPARDPAGEDREAERCRVGEHVPGVGDERERSGEPSSGGLDEREGCSDREGHPEGARLPRGHERRHVIVRSRPGVSMRSHRARILPCPMTGSVTASTPCFHVNRRRSPSPASTSPPASAVPCAWQRVRSMPSSAPRN